MKSVVIIGASGHGKVVADIIKKSGDEIYGFLDDNKKRTDLFLGLPILGTINDYSKFKNNHEFVIAIGNAKVRETISKKLNDVSWYTAIHPTAVISSFDVAIDIGTVVMANSVINSGAIVGKHCILNTGCIVEHGNRINDYAHISVGAKLAGTVCVGKRTWIGIGATISNNISICDDCMIGAGTVVINNITKSGTYVGVPAKLINKV